MKTLKIKTSTVFIPFLGLVLILASSCISISPSTVQLSANVGERLSEMEKLHQLAIQRYFDVEKQKVEDFLTYTWEPLFLKNFLGTSNVLNLLQMASKFDDNSKTIITETIKEYLEDDSEAEKAANDLIEKLDESRAGEDTIVRSILTTYIEDEKLNAAVIHVSSVLGTDEPARIIFEFAEAAHWEMQAQRKELLAPIELARNEVMAELSAAYAELIRGQSTITGRLDAASKRSKQQDLLLDRLGVKQISEDITNQLVNVSSKVDNAMRIANGLAEKEKEEGVEAIVGDILNAIKLELSSIPDIDSPSTPTNDN